MQPDLNLSLNNLQQKYNRIVEAKNLDNATLHALRPAFVQLAQARVRLQALPMSAALALISNISMQLAVAESLLDLNSKKPASIKNHVGLMDALNDENKYTVLGQLKSDTSFAIETMGSVYQLRTVLQLLEKTNYREAMRLEDALYAKSDYLRHICDISAQPVSSAYYHQPSLIRFCMQNFERMRPYLLKLFEADMAFAKASVTSATDYEAMEKILQNDPNALESFARTFVQCKPAPSHTSRASTPAREGDDSRERKQKADTAFKVLIEQTPNLSANEIKKHYRAYALVYHPDKHQNNPLMSDRFAQVTEAKNTLLAHNLQKNTAKP